MECPKCKSAISDDSRYCRFCGTQMTPSGRIRDSSTQRFPRHQELAAGTSILGRYEIIEELGRGGMGIVYKAEDTKLRRNVALKFLPWELTRNAEAKERFGHEAQAASSLDHPNICSIHEIEETDDGQIYISMGCYDGETLQDKIRQAPLSTEEAADIGVQVARGLQEAHERGIIHRDIKPSNIIVTTKGQAKVMDFGLAKLRGKTRLTKAGTTMGTVAYMSPEQGRGEDIDQRTDIWSLGVVLYEMVTGELPFKGEYDQAVIYSILNEEAKSMREVKREIPAEFEAIVTKCLKKLPEERYKSSSDLAVDLVPLGGDATSRRIGARPALGKTPAALARGSLLRVGIPVGIAILVVAMMTMVPKSRDAFRNLVGSGATPSEMKIALLPCSMEGGGDDAKAFCDGLTRTLTDRLARLEPYKNGLYVVPASDVQSLDRKNPTAVRQHFGANVVISGNLRWSDGDITLEPIRIDLGGESEKDSDTETLRQTGGTPIIDPIANLSTWQDSIVVRLAELLGLELRGEDREALAVRGTTVPAAYKSYLEGMGYLHAYEGDTDEDAAIRSFGKAIEQDSSYALAYAGLGKAYSYKYLCDGDMGWLELVFGACTRALEKDDQTAEAHLRLGIAFEYTADYEKALEHLRRAVEIDPKYSYAYIEMGDACAGLGDLDQAVRYYRRAIELRPHVPSGYDNLSYFYLLHGRYDDAIEPSLRLIDLMPKDGLGYNRLGHSYFYLDRWDEAKEIYETSLGIEPNAVAYANLGTIYFGRMRYADAAQMYRKALDILGENHQLYGFLAEACYWSPGGEDQALDAFRSAVRLGEENLARDPKNSALVSDLASYYARLGNHLRAEALLAQAIELKPIEPVTLFRIADTYEQLGQRESALEWVERALEKGAPMTTMDRFPGLRELRADPRYRRLIDRRKPS